LSVLIEFFGRIGLVEQLQSQEFYQPKSPNYYQPGQILVGFMLSVIAGAQRFAHANQLRGRTGFTRPAWIEALSQ
jgi:hypothetical protein